MLNINKLYNMKENKIKEMIKKKFDFKEIEKNINNIINTGELYFNYDNEKYISIIDILIPDRAGQYQQKELLELLLDYEIEEEEYKNNHHEYIEYIEFYLFQYIDDILKENLNIDEGIYTTIDYIQGDISLYIIVDIDYIPQLTQKPYKMIDVDLITNITEGYAIILEKEEYKNNVWYEVLHCFYSEDDNKFYYNIFTVDQEEFKGVNENDMLMIINSNVNNYITEEYKQANNHLTVLLQAELI